MTVHVLNNFLDSTLLRRTLLDIPRLPMARYDNPFEAKAFLEDKGSLEPDIARAISELTSQEATKWISRILDIPIDHADWPHYGGVFVYEPGDYLKPHVDAGIHPTKGLRKVATALLYLTTAELEFYNGEVCTEPTPTIIGLSQEYLLHANTLVLFTNHDYAWHGVPVVQGSYKRIVLTVSYLAPSSFQSPIFTNNRTRAYFGKCAWEETTEELDKLRELRASEEAHTVYRLGI